MFTRLSSLVLLLSLLPLTLVGCGGAEADSQSTTVSSVTITPVGNQMQFEQTEFTVAAGSDITLTFKNTATSPAMAHNVVLLADDDEATINRVGQAATGAGSNAYIPEDNAVLAATDLAQPGETVSVTFTAPREPGTYAYVCTFPGHYTMMQGTMVVKG